MAFCRPQLSIVPPEFCSVKIKNLAADFTVIDALLLARIDMDEPDSSASHHLGVHGRRHVCRRTIVVV